MAQPSFGDGAEEPLWLREHPFEGICFGWCLRVYTPALDSKEASWRPRFPRDFTTSRFVSFGFYDDSSFERNLFFLTLRSINVAF